MKAPTIDVTAVVLLVEIAFEATDDIEDFSEA
jgi:hypothetical protein